MGVIVSDSPDEPTPTKPLKQSSFGGGESKATPTLGPSTLQKTPNISFKYTTDEITPDEIKEWWDVQVPLKNLANDDRVSERAFKWVKEHLVRFQSTIQFQHERWAVNQSYIKGDMFDEMVGEAHSAEIFKAREAIVPRIYDSVFAYDEWYYVHGRDEIDAREEKKIKRKLDAQLIEDQFETKADNGIRSLVDYGLAVFKTHWKTETKMVRDREWSLKEIDGEKHMIPKITERERVTKNGPSTKMVNPFNFIIDLDEGNAEDALIIGDYCKMRFDEIAQMGKLQGWLNWEGLAQEKPRTRDDFAESHMHAQRPEGEIYEYGMRNAPQGSPAQFWVAEIWGMFDLFDTGIPRDCVVTVVNQSTIVRVQENPYDRKHRPYAIARANAEPFNFLGMSPIDHASRFESALTLFRYQALRAHEAYLAAPILVGNQFDLPFSVTDLPRPNMVIPVPDVGQVKALELPTPVREWKFVEESLKQDIEEVTGGTKILTGSEDSRTATESSHKLQESNRRLRGYSRAYAGMAKQVLEHFHLLNRQFAMRIDKFRVLGAEAAGMSVYEEIEPTIFRHDVDFDFAVGRSITTGEVRATQIAAVLQMLHPYLEVIASGVLDEDIDLLAMFEEMMRESTGMRTSKFFKKRTKPWDIVSAEQENQMLLLGQKPEVDEMNDDMKHLETHLPLLKDKAIQKDPDKMENTILHLAHHKMMYERKEQAAEAQRRKAAQMQQQQAMLQPDPKRGSTGRDRSAGPSLYDQPGQTPGGESPGPVNMQQMGSPDRRSPVPQESNEYRR